MSLADELVKEEMVLRLDRPFGLPTNIVENLSRYTGQPSPRAVRRQEVEASSERPRCGKCIQEGKRPRDANLTASKCAACNLPICGKHGIKKILCIDC